VVELLTFDFTTAVVIAKSAPPLILTLTVRVALGSPFIVSVFLDPIGIFDSASGTGFAFAMRATGTSGAYTSTNANDYVTTRGTSKGGTIASQNYLLSDIVTLSPNTQYYIWVFGVIDDVDQNSQGTRGIRDGAIQIYGLNK